MAAKPFVLLRDDQWRTFRNVAENLDLSSADAPLLTSGIFGTKKDAQFYRDICATALGTTFAQSTDGHENFALLSKPDQKEFLESLILNTKDDYESEVDNVMNNCLPSVPDDQPTQVSNFPDAPESMSLDLFCAMGIVRCSYNEFIVHLYNMSLFIRNMYGLRQNAK